MAATPDLSKIVEVIMQNPELIAQISSLVTSGKTDDATSDNQLSENDTSTPDITTEHIEASAPPIDSTNPRSSRRELLCALKPYLSENRKAAIDSMISISDVLAMMRK